MFTLAPIIEANAQEVTVKLVLPDSVIAGQEFEIKIRIGKGDIVSFAKLQLEIPGTFEVDSLKSEGARFRLNDTQAKYIWDQMPIKDTLEVSFKTNTDPAFSGARGINGSFSFIYNEAKQEVRIPTKVIRIMPLTVAIASESQVAVGNELDEGFETASKKSLVDNDNSQTEEENVDDEIKDILASIEAEPINDAVKEEVKEVVPEIVAKEVPEPSESPAKKEFVAIKKTIPEKAIIEFRVQIIASAVRIDMSRLKLRYKLAEEIHSEFHNGLWKYTVGSHSTYPEAKKNIPLYRDQKGVEGAFITAYLNGVRIPVGEAIKQTK